MPKEEWGVKRLCPTTGKRFYDLGRDPVVSPYTGEVVPIDTGPKSRGLIKSEKEKAKQTAEKADAEEVLVEDDTTDDDVDLADDVLDDDDDDDDDVSLDDIADMSTDDDDS